MSAETMLLRISEIVEFILVRNRHQICYADSSPTGHFPTDTSGMHTSRHLPIKIFPRRDISPNISPIICCNSIFLNLFQILFLVPTGLY